MPDTLKLKDHWFTCAHEGLVRKFDGSALEAHEPCAIGFLNAASIDAVVALHEEVWQGLAVGEKGFMQQKPAAYFKTHFAKAGHGIVGIRHNGKLVAKSMIIAPSISEPYTWHVGVTPPAPDTQISVLQGVCVANAYRGNNFMQEMISGWKIFAAQSGKTHLVAEVEPENKHSLDNFLAAGFSAIATAIDASDNVPVHVLALKL
ncbi:MAG: hypothetical protein GC136_03340 [Alphaproteobacteria bacterium]|nr:hypothetical protein [Alphaproteobacteria bacterium]